MATAKKTAQPTDEEAHFRIDDHERRLGGVEKALTPESVTALVSGAAAAFHSQMKGELEEQMQGQTERLLKAVQQDIESDKAVVASLKELCEEMRGLVATLKKPDEDDDRELIEEMRALIAVLKTPTSRTATIELPSGPATMTVRETRQ